MFLALHPSNIPVLLCCHQIVTGFHSELCSIDVTYYIHSVSALGLRANTESMANLNKCVLFDDFIDVLISRSEGIPKFETFDSFKGSFFLNKKYLSETTRGDYLLVS